LRKIKIFYQSNRGDCLLGTDRNLVKKQKRALDSGGFMGGERGGVQGL
jgi:hypothetical protein